MYTYAWPFSQLYEKCSFSNESCINLPYFLFGPCFREVLNLVSYIYSDREKWCLCVCACVHACICVNMQACVYEWERWGKCIHVYMLVSRKYKSRSRICVKHDRLPRSLSPETYTHACIPACTHTHIMHKHKNVNRRMPMPSLQLYIYRKPGFGRGVALYKLTYYYYSY